MILKNTILAIVVLFIAGSIWYIELKEARAPSSVTGALLTDIPEVEVPMPSLPTTTVATTTVSATAPTPVIQAKKTPTTKTPMQTNTHPPLQKTPYPAAHDIVPGGGFINSEPFSLKDLVGKKVILVDFWTYSCYNCKNTTPYLKDWYQKYKDQGLEIVGVHTPEFDFEKDLANVSKAVLEAGIEYPVVQDNNYAIWNTYGNRFWPHMYLIDIDGYIVYDHIGEGAYADTEAAIVKALRARSDSVKS